MGKRLVAVIGATSFVGGQILPMLTGKVDQVVAFSRRPITADNATVSWYQAPTPDAPLSCPPTLQGAYIQEWICLAPIYTLPDYFELMQAHGAKRVVALSSTSRFTKSTSFDAEEKRIADRMAAGEARLQAWAEANGVESVILRPTLIYGLGLDKNISEITRLIRRAGFFPLFGAARGLRQPIRVEDVAQACISALESQAAANHAYNISGAETLTYREMVRRIFVTLERRPRLVTVPLWLFKAAVTLLRALPRYRRWNVAMADRMNQDLVFDHADAARDLGFSPQPFNLSRQDLPA